MEFLTIYLISSVLGFCLFVFNNYLVKIKKLDYKWRIEAEIFWFFVLCPVVNIIMFIIVLCTFIFHLTKNFIEQN
jgi:hypothetical protein